MVCLGLSMVNTAYGAPLRSFAMMPVEKDGYVMRLTLAQTQSTQANMLLTNVAYGISTTQAILLGIPAKLSMSGKPIGDVSVLYRHVLWQQENAMLSNSFGMLAGVVLPSRAGAWGKQSGAAQVGLVFTHIKKRNEIDMDVLYQAGLNGRADSARYDISWQYRLLPSQRADWGVSPELNSVLEYNGRWREGKYKLYQLTAGLQWVHQTWVLEGDALTNINDNSGLRYQVSTRFHF